MAKPFKTQDAIAGSVSKAIMPIQYGNNNRIIGKRSQMGMGFSLSIYILLTCLK